MKAAAVAGGGAIAAIGAAAFALLVRGALTFDLGVGRSLRPLGPLTFAIDAPREVVFDVIAEPYLGRTPRALEGKLRVVERGENMVLAEHFTDVGRFVTTTLETVRFHRPERVDFRLVRGPVPHVVETFEASRDGAWNRAGVQRRARCGSVGAGAVVGRRRLRQMGRGGGERARRGEARGRAPQRPTVNDYPVLARCR